MNKRSETGFSLTRKLSYSELFALIAGIVALGAVVFGIGGAVSAQRPDRPDTPPPTIFPVGEKLTYAVSFGPFRNAGIAEIEAVSRGRLEGRDAVELRSKFKTNEIVSAAFYLLDEARTTFAAADSGLPLYIRKTSSAGVVPVDTTASFLAAPTQNYDLLTLVYRLRAAGGAGGFLLQEDERSYSLTAVGGAAEKVKTDAGEFETVISAVQSEYFTQKGLSDFRINFTTDERRLPVLIRFKTARGEFRAALAGWEDAAPLVTPTPTPTPAATPTPAPTPVPTATPLPDNLPLSANLPFVLGETLEYRVTTRGQFVGTVVTEVGPRKTVGRRDTLFLKARVTAAERNLGLFTAGDEIVAQVDADSLVPFRFEAKLTGGLSGFNQTVQFDQEKGAAVFGGANQAMIPLNTHSFLSLWYAMRSFNLKPSIDKKNPSDTKVSVFYDSKAYVFTLRPIEMQILTVRGQPVPAQVILLVTENPQLDALGLRIWLSNTERRTPLRLAIGPYQADLVAESVVRPQ